MSCVWWGQTLGTLGDFEATPANMGVPQCHEFEPVLPCDHDVLFRVDVSHMIGSRGSPRGLPDVSAEIVDGEGLP